MLFTCQPAFELLLERELGELGRKTVERGPGWILSSPGALPTDCVFAHLVLPNPAEIRGESVNTMARGLGHFFMESLRGERLEAPWPCVFAEAAGADGLGRRAAAVKKAFLETLQRRLSRVAKLAADGPPKGIGPARGLWAEFVGFDRILASRDAFVNGPRRMADDPLAPSRSYLKVEEAYGILGCEPRPGETVADLGAAPGGWSYSAAKRGARVMAIDNGPLKGGALGHPGIEHRRIDAFKFRPADGQVFDWLFCDLVEEPHHVLRQIADPWIGRGWCRHFVINLKFGRADPLALLGELKQAFSARFGADSPISTRASGWLIRHLYHDREELTVVGRVCA